MRPPWALGGLALLVVGCGRAAPAGGALAPPAPSRDPWTIQAGEGVTRGEPDAAFVPRTSTRRTVDPEEAAGAPPPGSAADAPSGEHGRVAEVASALTGIRAAIRRCYADALRRDPTLTGPTGAELRWEGGKAIVLFEGKPPAGALEVCIAGVIARGMGPPDPPSTIVIPFTRGDM